MSRLLRHLICANSLLQQPSATTTDIDEDAVRRNFADQNETEGLNLIAITNIESNLDQARK